MELADILASIRRRWRIAVGMLLLTCAVVAAFYLTRNEVEPTPKFRGQVDLLVPTRDEEGAIPGGVPPSLFFGQAALAQSPEVREQALDEAEVPDDERAGIGFGYSQNETGDIVSLTVTGGESDVAQRVARTWTDAYTNARAARAADGAEERQDRSYRSLQVLDGRLRGVNAEITGIDPQLFNLSVGTSESGASTVPLDLPIDVALLVYERADIQARIESARREWAEAKSGALVSSEHATIVEIPAVRNITPATDSPETPTLLIVAIGLVLALAVPVLVDRMDHTIRDAKTAAAAFSAPVLSLIPAVSRSKRFEIARPGTAREGAFRALAATSVATDRLPRAVVVTSPLGAEQDEVAANFAAALANLGVRVALIGTSPRQAWFAQISLASDGEERATFPQLLEMAYAGRLNGEAPSHLGRTSLDNFFILPPGPTDIDVSSDGLAPMLHALESANIDVTVIAAPALLQDPNTTIYAWTTRSVLWVMETGEITVEEARDAASRLALAGVTPLGVAMVEQES